MNSPFSPELWSQFLNPEVETVYYLSMIGIFARFLIPVSFIYFTFIFRSSFLLNHKPMTRFKIIFLPKRISKKYIGTDERSEFSKFLRRRVILISVITFSSLYNSGLYLYLDKVLANSERCRLEKNCDYHKKVKQCKGEDDVACL